MATTGLFALSLGGFRKKRDTPKPARGEVLRLLGGGRSTTHGDQSGLADENRFEARTTSHHLGQRSETWGRDGGRDGVLFLLFFCVFFGSCFFFLVWFGLIICRVWIDYD